MQFDTFTFGFTFQCNLSCLYCYEKGYREQPEFSKSEIEEYIYPAIEDMRPKNLDIDGGEPITRWEDLITFLEHASSFDSLELINICSNGIQLTADKVKKIQKTVGKDIYLAFTLSLDTFTPEEDVRAPRLHGRQISAVQRLLEMKQPVILGCTVTKLNLSTITSYLQGLREMGILVGLTPALFPPPEIALSRIEMQEVDRLRAEHLFDPILAPDQTPVPVNPKVWEEDLLPVFEMLGLDMCFGCPACSSAVSVRANGDVKACGCHNFTLGNLRETLFKEILDQEYIKKVQNLDVGGACGSCRYVELCRGGCKVRAKMETGDYLGGIRTCYYQTPRDIPHPDEARITQRVQERLESGDVLKYLETLGKND
ncbi:MAG: SPASM domain-containing protein [Candidatus Odinarchaeota archaeon]